MCVTKVRFINSTKNIKEPKNLIHVYYPSFYKKPLIVSPFYSKLTLTRDGERSVNFAILEKILIGLDFKIG